MSALFPGGIHVVRRVSVAVLTLGVIAPLLTACSLANLSADHTTLTVDQPAPDGTTLFPCTGKSGHITTCQSTTTTTTTLPPALQLGQTAVLSLDYPGGVIGGQFTVHRVWVGATPEFHGQSLWTGATFSQFLIQTLRAAHLPPTQQLEWVGIDLSIETQRGFQLVSPGGPGAPFLTFVVNGQGPVSGDTDTWLVTEAGFSVGVPGCPFPFESLAVASGASISGCVAVPVPAGTTVSTVGFNLAQPGEILGRVAQWQA